MDHVIYTIGHSTHEIGEFLRIIQHYGVEIVIDVRKIAKSRRNPQFNADELAASLREHGLGYAHLEGLAGLRRTTALSPNTAWKNLSFRGYADYTQTPEFARSCADLLAIADERCPVLMCAEVLPWRCHRSLIADALAVRGRAVRHIMSETASPPHRLTPFAHVDGEAITYPGEAP